MQTFAPYTSVLLAVTVALFSTVTSTIWIESEAASPLSARVVRKTAELAGPPFENAETLV